MVSHSATKDSGGPPGGSPGRPASAPTPNGATMSINRSDGSGEPIAILLVDDDPDCRMLIRDAIEESKVSNRVFEVPDGLEAIEFLSRRGKYAGAPRPGLIYLDIEMPGMNGQETLRR